MDSLRWSQASRWRNDSQDRLCGMSSESWYPELTAERRLSMRVSQTSCPPSSFVAQSGPPKPSAQIHTPRLWTQQKEAQGSPDHHPSHLADLVPPVPTWLQIPAPVWALQFSGHKAMRQCGPAQPWGHRQSPAPAAPSWGTHSWGTGQLPGPPDPQRAEPTEALKPQDEEPLASQCSTSSPVEREDVFWTLLHPQMWRAPSVIRQGSTLVIYNHCHD